jgi:hypothetical protein
LIYDNTEPFTHQRERESKRILLVQTHTHTVKPIDFSTSHEQRPYEQKTAKFFLMFLEKSPSTSLDDGRLGDRKLKMDKSRAYTA